MDNFNNGDHALLTGGLVGHLMNNGVEVRPVYDAEGNYTPELVISMPSFSPGSPTQEVTIAVKDPQWQTS